MEVINIDEGRYEQRDTLLPSSSNGSSSMSESNYSSELSSDDLDKSDDEDLREDLQKTIRECYKSDSNYTSQAYTNTANDEEFQATALCQFMDILNDLDEVLDKSLLACLDDGAKSYDSDDEDLICKIKECIGDAGHPDDSGAHCSIDDNAQVVTANIVPTQVENIHSQNVPERPIPLLGRSKSFTEPSGNQRQALVPSLERAGTTNDNVRNSMRCLDPIVLPAISAEESNEPLTLPVILFLEHHVDLRPTSAPIQLQVTAANLSSDGSSGPLIVGRRALLMNRALSLPSPGDSDVTRDWTGRSARSTARSSSSSSDSSETLTGVTTADQTAIGPIEERNEETEEPPFGVWPHRMSAMLACLSCTIGIFNISRFAIFSVHFGANFIVQFLILSLLIGIPLFTLYLCLGQVLESGPVDMWKISPIFQGVGVSMLIMQAITGIYSIIGLSWIFVYFRDSFITSNDKYKWALPHEFNFEDSAGKNVSFKIQDTLPQYFHGEVLQKNAGTNGFGTIKFQVAFNLAVVWMIVFVALSKGLRSYGKAVYMLIFLPLCGTLVLCTKLLTLIPYDSVTNIFAETDWGEFFTNTNSWTAAAQETFLTWGLLGACVMQLTSHKNAKEKTSTVLQKESACIVAFTFAVLLLAAFLANTCVQILRNHGYAYIPGSYETVQSSQSLWPTSEPLPGPLATPARYRQHYASLVGVTAWRTDGRSGWAPLQLAATLAPATLAVLPANVLSPGWAVIFYFILIMFGLAQQLAIWHCVITGIMAINPAALRVWETTITFLSCVLGLGLGLLLTTDAGVRVVHYVDYVCVGAWGPAAVHVALAVGVFVVRGRPYAADKVVQALYAHRTRTETALATLLSFTWTVAAPVLLCAISVMDFRAGQQRQLYSWRKPAGYWPVWARQTAVAIQQGLLLVVPAAAFVQTWRYMSKGPPDILDRVQNLYRPPLGGAASPLPARAPAPAPAAPAPDPPPKYTPPPSYSTATGARLLNTLRRSFRTLRSDRGVGVRPRSVAKAVDSSWCEAPNLRVSCQQVSRITSVRSTSLPRDDTSQTPITLSESVSRRPLPPPLPPAYTAPAPSLPRELAPPPARSSVSLTREYLRRSFVRTDPAHAVRASLRRSFKYAHSTSHERLVRDAEPISNTVAMSAMLETEDSLQARSRASVI